MNNSRSINSRTARWCLFLFACLPMLVAACAGSPPPQPTSTAVAAPLPTATATAVIPETGAQPTSQGNDGCPPTSVDARAEQPLTLGPINGLEASSATGERLIITGTVYDRNCNPVPGMALSFWQTDAQGVYGPGQGTENIECCYYGGDTTTDAQGRYTLLTVMPGVYLNQASPPPAHIHVEGRHSSGAHVESEIVFQDDPYLQGNYDNPPPIALQSGSDEQGDFLIGAADLRLEQVVGAAPKVSASASSQTFAILPGESSASYHIREKFADMVEMVSPVGVTGGVEGEIQLDMTATPTLKGMSVTVDLTGLRTDEPSRDEKLADRWLVTNDFPTASFTAREVKGGPAAYQDGQEVSFTLSGDLTIRDVTRPVDFAVTATLSGDTLDGQAETKILMSDFGIQPPNLLGFVKVEDEVIVQVKLKAVQE